MAGKRDLRQLPELEGWVSFPDAAEEIGISRQRLFQLAEKTDPTVVETAVRIGKHRPVYVMREAEVAELKARGEVKGNKEPWFSQ
jgi:hypothetical protein